MMECMVEEGHIFSNGLRTALISLKSSSNSFDYRFICPDFYRKSKQKPTRITQQTGLSITVRLLFFLIPFEWFLEGEVEEKERENTVGDARGRAGTRKMIAYRRNYWAGPSSDAASLIRQKFVHKSGQRHAEGGRVLLNYSEHKITFSLCPLFLVFSNWNLGISP